MDAVFIDLSEWQMWRASVPVEKEHQLHAWPMEDEGAKPTVMFMRMLDEPYGRGEFEFFGSKWGLVPPGDPIIDRWAARDAYAPAIDLSQLSDDAADMFTELKPVATTPALFYDDMYGAWLKRLRPPPPAENNALFQGVLGKLLLALIVMTVVVAMVSMCRGGV